MLQSLIHWMKQSNIVPKIQKSMTQLKTVIIAGKVAAITSTTRYMMEKKNYWMRMETLWI